MSFIVLRQSLNKPFSVLPSVDYNLDPKAKTYLLILVSFQSLGLLAGYWCRVMSIKAFRLIRRVCKKAFSSKSDVWVREPEDVSSGFETSKL